MGGNVRKRMVETYARGGRKNRNEREGNLQGRQRQTGCRHLEIMASPVVWYSYLESLFGLGPFFVRGCIHS